MPAMLVATALIGCAPAAAAPPVSTMAALDAAIAAARGGETILVAPGDYGEVRVFDRAYAAPVTIRSADPRRPARMRRFRVIGSRNVRVQDVDIGSALAPDEKEWTRVAEVFRSRDVVLERVRMHGSLDGNPQNDGWGLFMRDSRDIQVLDSEFTELALGILAESIDGLVVRGNHFHHLQRDGADFAGVVGVRIEGNRFHDFYPKDGAHPDAIQFWTAKQTRSSTDIVIRDNVILQGAGGGLQGIFLGNEIRLPYANVAIENNLLYSAVQYHGISVYHGDGVRIVGNTVVSPPEDAARYWIRLDHVTNGVVAGNVADDLTLEQSRAETSDNLIFAKGANGRRLLKGLAAGAAATPAGLIVPDRGYQPPRGTAR